MRPKQNKKKLVIAITVGVLVSLVLFSQIGGVNKRVQEQIQIANAYKKQLDAERAQKKDATSVDSVQIVVAKSLLLKDTKLTKEMLELKDHKIAALRPEHIKNMDSIVGCTLNVSLNPGEPITTWLLKELQPKTLEVPQGMRAITIPIEYIQGLASYVEIGSKLDLHSASRENTKEKGELIVQNIKVIAFEKKEQPSPVEGQKPIEAISAVTIEVPAAKTAKLVEAMVNGKLQLALRNINDDEIIALPKKAVAQAPPFNPPPSLPTSILPPINMKNINDLPVPAAPPKKPSKPPATVEFIQANVKSEVTFND
ncbi:MAG: Flp pilus assembly protein CpaB [uncultured bacterium]|nr:MAG: Flp pilus assembly protein CpaB [uncultured bacterium]HBH18036.1 Flp pilus assembly protein CpaB [Cyanobacteria bacterium UBA9579]